jgi:hypothetical protein
LFEVDAQVKLNDSKKVSMKIIFDVLAEERELVSSTGWAGLAASGGIGRMTGTAGTLVYWYSGKF